MIGKEILNYRIVSLIGKGGMGSVYLAEHTLIKNEKVAIKVINANMANDFTRSLLREEAEHLAGLKHPNIVAFKNYHIDEAGNIYLIMEYADGVSLEDYIKNVNGLIVEDKVCAIFEPILDAVGYAHKNRILHRDIKPANIIITKEGIPKILDFGIAQIIKNQGEDNQDNLIMGTPSYMSPEQVKGEHLDERSDIYSLGVLLHHMLTGNPPYDTTTLTEQDINEKVVEEPLPRMKTFYKYVSDKVQKVVDKATAKDPKDRYQSCEEFKKSLHRAIYPPQMPKWAKFTIAGVLALLIFCGWYAWDYNRIKVYYYKDYTERWGVPEGIGELSASEHSHAYRSYKFVFQKRKLLRVSHVNSLDNLIEDGESERIERPVDQEFYYTAEGKVTRIVVKDRCGKVLYVKSFNDKLNTMAFQFDDEHGTERIISNSTVGYTKMVDNFDAKKGRISRWWIEYDDNGYISSIKYAGLDNSAVGDENGIFGRTYVRDEKGRAIEIHYIGVDGNPQPTKWGLGIKKFFYDDEDNWVKAEYLTVDGKPALDDTDGTCIFSMEYDQYGNCVYQYYQDSHGNLMLPQKHNVAGVHDEYDDKGFNITRTSLGLDKNPMIVPNSGFAIIQYKYDENGYITKADFLDTNKKLCDTKDGYASVVQINNSKGNPTEWWFYNSEGKLCESSEGKAGEKSEYDSIGNLTKNIYYGIDKRPVADATGTYGVIYTYNDRGLCSSYTSLGKDLKPAKDNDGVTTVKIEYNKRGAYCKYSYYEADGKTSCLNNDGISGWNTVYDDNGNRIEVDYFGKDGKPAISVRDNYAKVTYEYDKYGNLKSERFWDTKGNLTLSNGIAGNDYICNTAGFTLQEKPVGKDGKLAKNKFIIKYKYDKFNNCIERSLFDESGPVTNLYGVHKQTYKYNEQNLVIETANYDKNSNLTINKEYGCAVEVIKYDEKGHKTFNQFLGTDLKPCKSLQGWSSATYEIDVFGNTTKQCFFDINGKPTDPKDMVPVGIAKYDKWGNLIFVAAQDGNGNYIIKPDTGWAICRYEYDKKNNCISIACYDTKDKPTIGKEGYYKCMMKYDNQNRLIEKCFIGTDNKPMTDKNVHKVTCKYSDKGYNNICEEAYFGINGNKVNCSEGYHKFIVTYNENGTQALRYDYYTADGSLLGSMVWNGYEWTLAERPYDWKEDAKAFMRQFPHSYGSDSYGLTAKSLAITGSNSCEVVFTFSYTTSQLQSTVVTQLKDVVRNFVDYLETAFNNNATVTGYLYDKNNSLVYTYKK